MEQNKEDLLHVYNLSVEEFLSYLKNSYINLTASYHAVCFSLIFEKNFAIVNRAHSSRILSLLDIVGLSDRILNLDHECTEHNIDYISVTEKISSFKKVSEEYLRDILRG